ncbi:NYN domain-containing protein [soil metagenome]
MRWIVDGNNVMGSRPDGWWRDRPAAMSRLVSELVAFARRTGDEVTVFFDGGPFALDGGDAVAVRFASRRGPNAADDDIAALTAQEAEAGDLVVATSDAGLAARVRESGIEVEGAGAFLRRLQSSRRS